MRRAARDVGSSAEKGDAGATRYVSEHPHACERRTVSQIVIREGDSFEVALKRFTRKVQQDGILSEAKRHARYESPSMKRKRKEDARLRKARKAAAKAAARGY
jgi:small subunit ribosomal protein S21